MFEDDEIKEIDDFSDSIINNRPVIDGTSEDALKVMQMIFEIYKADKSWWKTINN